MLTLLLASLVIGPGGDAATVAPDLVVHEWGTFTSMQGSDGVTLEGLQHEEEALPRFVHALEGEWAGEFGLLVTKGLWGSLRGVTVKMETPVTYFYAPRPLAVRARVELEHGLLTQWYPAVAQAGALGAERAGARSVLDFAGVERGSLEWEVDVLAPHTGLESVPDAGDGHPWSRARLPESNAVRAHVAAQGERPAHDETEEFLFYRGLGRFDLPIRARTLESGELEIANTSKVAGDVLTHLFVLEVREGRAAFRYVPALEPGRSVALARPLVEGSPALDDTIAELEPALARALVASGLFELEAQAMVKTWETSYFRTPGLRVLYGVPRRVTDAILPLSIEPRPSAMVRVLVGRLECLTPDIEREVEARLLRFANADQDGQIEALDDLGRLGRFLEPHLRRAYAATADRRIAAAARNVLGSL